MEDDTSKRTIASGLRPLAAAALLALPVTAAALPFFSGFGEFGANMDLYDNATDPRVSSFVAFDGQFDLNGVLFGQIAFNVATPEPFPLAMEAKTPEESAESFFKIDEIAVTYRFHTMNTIQYLTAYTGDHETFGTQIFLQRQFGVKSIGSMLTETRGSGKGLAVFDSGMFGASYTVRYRSPLAGAFSIQGNKNGDIWTVAVSGRLAGAFPGIIFDAQAGMDFPAGSESDAFVEIRAVSPRAGLNMLLGDRYNLSFLVQAALLDVWVKPEQEAITIDNLYALAELRYAALPIKLYLTGFCMPQNLYSSLFYITSQYGANLAIFSDIVPAGKWASTVGINFSFAMDNVSDEDARPRGFKPEFGALVAPFYTIDFPNGALNLAARVDVLHLTRDKAVTLKIGYCASF